MSRQIALLCIVAVFSWSVVSAQVLVPPTGYSVGFSGTVRHGVQKYVCSDGTWMKTGTSASMYTPLGVRLGTHWSEHDPVDRSITYFWNIINSGAGVFESGSRDSGIQGVPVATVQVVPTAVAEYLAVVTNHTGSGDADQVAFASCTATAGGMAPRDELCSADGVTSRVPYDGNFTFYTQDLVPPPKLPTSITPPGTFVQTVFVDGKLTYKFVDGEWKYSGFFATMAAVAGGKPLGKVGTSSTPDNFGSDVSWEFDAPNAYTLNGHMVTAVPVTADGCPWQLLQITSQTGYELPLGSYKYALLGATYGGKSPAIAAKINGLEWGSVFTGQFYLYT